MQRKIDEARREGRGDDAARMQRQLNRLQQKDSQMQQMQQMAEDMNQSAKAMKQGDGSHAADALEHMSDQLGELASFSDPALSWGFGASVRMSNRLSENKKLKTPV